MYLHNEAVKLAKSLNIGTDFYGDYNIYDKWHNNYNASKQRDNF